MRRGDGSRVSPDASGTVPGAFLKLVPPSFPTFDLHSRVIHWGRFLLHAPDGALRPGKLSCLA
jgi:hypothetical protein